MKIKCDCCKEEYLGKLLECKGYALCPSCYMGYVNKFEICKHNKEYETEIERLREQAHSGMDLYNLMVRYVLTTYNSDPIASIDLSDLLVAYYNAIEIDPQSEPQIEMQLFTPEFDGNEPTGELGDFVCGWRIL